MPFIRNIILSAFCVAVFPSTVLSAATRNVISSYKNAPSPVTHAVQRLAEYIGLPVGKGGSATSALRVELNSQENPRTGAQGYTIRSANHNIVISGNTSEGAANGIYTLLRMAAMILPPYLPTSPTPISSYYAMREITPRS